MALVSLANLKLEMGISGTAEDTLLTRYLDQATERVEAIVRYALEDDERVHEVYLDRPTRRVMLPSLAVTAIASVTEDEVVRASTAYTVLSNHPGILFAADGQTWFSGRVIVTYQSGYTWPDNDEEAGNVPAVIQAATILLARSMYSSRSRDAGLRSESVPGVYSWTAGEGGSADAAERSARYLLGPHVLPVIG